MAQHSDIATIKIAIKQLGISDDDGNAELGVLSTYRTMLKKITGKTSVSADVMTDTDRRRVIQHLKSQGFKTGRRQRTRGHSDKHPVMATDNQIAMVYGLWRELEESGQLRSKGNAALNAWLKRFTPKFNKGVGLDAPEFLPFPAAEKVIEALKNWLTRAAPGRNQ